ncbi:MAG TPA: hypothetical protein VGB53_02295 [Rubricoccaceae bacterium]|jgi:hypothetical protein
MPSYVRLPIVERLDLVDRALRALVQDGEMMARLALRGFKKKRLDEGRALLDAVRTARRTQDSELGEQFDATDDAGAAWTAVRKPYMAEVTFAREALAGDRGALEDLGLLGRRARTRAAAIDQAHNFYASAMKRPDLAERLDGVGITAETLAAGLARVEALAEARGDQQGETADATHATVSKDTQLEALDTWAGSFVRTARAEFADEPERLDRLGL